MEISPRPPRQGVGLIFILLALIALLAITIVLLSQLRHSNTPQAKDPSYSNGMELPAIGTETSGSDTGTDFNAGSPSSDADKLRQSESADPGSPLMTFPPPPPPAMATPDSSHLPPEG